MRRIAKRAVLLLGLCAFSPPPALAVDTGSTWKDDEIAATATFEKYHPDQGLRREGLRAYGQMHYKRAYLRFKDAAYYADKPSQAMLAEMLWRGIGIEPDRAAGYAWMDLAAERGYKPFLAYREQYWAELDEEERVRARELGAELYAEYGDQVAQPRLERMLVRGSRSTYKSITHAAYARVYVRDGFGYQQIVTGFYEPRYWQPKRYWQWQDRMWREPPTGTVRVGPLELDGNSVPQASAAAAPGRAAVRDTSDGGVE